MFWKEWDRRWKAFRICFWRECNLFINIVLLFVNRPTFFFIIHSFVSPIDTSPKWSVLVDVYWTWTKIIGTLLKFQKCAAQCQHFIFERFVSLDLVFDLKHRMLKHYSTVSILCLTHMQNSFSRHFSHGNFISVKWWMTIYVKRMRAILILLL